MAKVQAAANEKIYQIKRWLGVNQALEGEASLKIGEAADMRNFKVTAGGALQKRGGSRNVAGLMNEYNVLVDTETEEMLETEYGVSAGLAMYPRAKTDSVGTPVPDGEMVMVNAENEETYQSYYYQKDGALYQCSGYKFTPRRIYKSYTREWTWNMQEDGDQIYAYFCVYDSVYWNGAEWVGVNPQIFCKTQTQRDPYLFPNKENFVGKYIVFDRSGVADITDRRVPFNPNLTEDDFKAKYNTEGISAKITKLTNTWVSQDGWGFGFETEAYYEAYWEWNFHPTYSEGNGSDSKVRGIWSGFVAGREVLCTACNGYLWELSFTDGVWSKVSCGAIDTAQDVYMFGFDEKLYLLNGEDYKVWNGAALTDVEGYRPLVSITAAPAGGGTNYEPINKLNGCRRAWFSPDGESTVCKLPETNVASIDWVRNRASGENYEADAYTADLAAGTVTFTAAPETGVNTLEIAWTNSTNFRGQVTAMRYAELYNGAQDSRVFVYGDGTNKAIYTGLDYDGNPRADYFPDLNVCDVGDANTPITGMIRHYGKLLAFKMDSAYSIAYDTITLEDGTVTAGFYVTSVNRDIGNCAPGQVRLVENRPRTLDGRSVMEWKANSYGNFTNDQRNAERISQRVDSTIRTFDLTDAKAFYDKITHEYYVIGTDGTALIHNVDADAWYVYTDFAATCLISYKDELYYGTGDGYLRHFSNSYPDDEGQAIDAYWESGSISFTEDFKRKYSAMLWIGIKPEENGYLAVTAETDRKADFAEYAFTTTDKGGVPEMNRIKLKAKKFTYYKLILKNNTADTTATVVSADIRVRGTGYVR